MLPLLLLLLLCAAAAFCVYLYMPQHLLCAIGSITLCCCWHCL
jgi:hypothetical protein